MVKPNPKAEKKVKWIGVIAQLFKIALSSFFERKDKRDEEAKYIDRAEPNLGKRNAIIKRVLLKRKTRKPIQPE